jgi:hypothetical protein
MDDPKLIVPPCTHEEDAQPCKWVPGSGTLTRLGWAWKCERCGKLLFLFSDQFIPTVCPEPGCGGRLIDCPVEEAREAERKSGFPWCE